MGGFYNNSFDQVSLGPPVDPHRDPIADHKYDFSFASEGVKATLGMTPGVGPLFSAAPSLTTRMVDQQLSWLGSLAYWVDRPYTAIVSGLDGAARGRNPLKESWKGLTGQREASMVNMLDDFGFDPDSTAVQLSGVVLDVAAGSFIDPVNYLSFGASRPLQGLAKGAKVLGEISEAGRALKAAEMVKAGKWSQKLADEVIGGITNTRQELAAKGLWGAQLQVPWMPFKSTITQAIPSTARIMNEGVVLGPAWVNEGIAKGLDAAGALLQPYNDVLHKYVGGSRYMQERYGLENEQDYAQMLRAAHMQDQVRHARRVKEYAEDPSMTPEMLRETIFHSLENPELVNGQGIAFANEVRQMTPQEIMAHNAERMKVARKQAEALQDFNNGIVAEADGVRESLEAWTETRKRLIPINFMDVAESYTTMMQQAGGSRGVLGVEDLATEMMRDPNLMSEVISVLAQNGDLGVDVKRMIEIDPLTMPTFRALIPGKFYEKTGTTRPVNPPLKTKGVKLSRENAKYLRGTGDVDGTILKHAGSQPIQKSDGSMTTLAEVIESIGKNQPVDQKAADRANEIMDAYRGKLQPAYDEYDAARSKGDFKERKRSESERASEALRQANRKGASVNIFDNEADEVGQLYGEGAESATGVNRSAPMLVLEIPESGTLSDEFGKRFGGSGGLEKRKKRAFAVVDALQAHARSGGNSWELITKYMDTLEEGLPEEILAQRKRAYQKAVQEANKKLGNINAAKGATFQFDANSATQGKILEAVYHRRISNTMTPGDYTASAEAIAREKEADVLFGDAADETADEFKTLTMDDIGMRWIAQQDYLRREHENVMIKIKQLDSGHVPTAEFVPPDAMHIEDYEQVLQNAPLWDRFVEEAANLEQAKATIRGEAARLAGSADEMNPVHEYFRNETDINALYLSEAEHVDGEIELIRERQAELHEKYGQEIDAAKKEIAELSKQEFVIKSALDSWEVDSVRELEARYKMELLERKKQIEGALRNQDPFQRSAWIYSNLKAKTKPVKPKVVGIVANPEKALENIGIALSPEQAELVERGKALMADVDDVYARRYRQEQPDWKPPFSNYMPHDLAMPRTAGDVIYDLLTGKTVKRWKDRKKFREGRMAEYRAAYPTGSLEDLKARVAQEEAEVFGSQPVKLSKAEADKGPSAFRTRKYSIAEPETDPLAKGKYQEKATVLVMQRSGFPRNFVTDFTRAVNSHYHTAQKFDFLTKLTDHLIENGHARNLPDKITKAEDAARMLGIDVGRVAKPKTNLGWAFSMMDDQTKNPYRNIWMSKEAADFLDQQLTGFNGMFGDPNTRAFLDKLNVVRKWFSSWTLLNPVSAVSFVFRNFGGDMLRAMSLVGPEGVSMTKGNLMPALKIAGMTYSDTRGSDYVPGMLKMVTGLGENPTRTVRDAVTQKANQWRNMIAQGAGASGQMNYLDPDNILLYMRGNVLEQRLRDVDEVGDTGQRGASTIAKILNWTPLVGTGESNRLLHITGGVSTVAQNQLRAMVWFNQVDNYLATGLYGIDQAFAAATRDVRKSLFDYSDLTGFEQNIMKNINYFYTYLSKSIPFHLERLVKSPGTFAPYYRAYMGFWNNYQDEFEPTDARDFLVKQLGVPIMDERDPETGEWKALMWSPTGWIGVADINEAAEWVRSFTSIVPGDWDSDGVGIDHEGLMQALGQNIAPPWKMALEGIFKRDLLTGREIADNEWTDMFGVSMNQWTARVVRNIRILNDIDRLNPGNIWTKIAQKRGTIINERAHRHEADQPARWVQQLFGWRLFESNPEQDIGRDIREARTGVAEYKGQMKAAQRDGNLKEYRENAELLLLEMQKLDMLTEMSSVWQEQNDQAKRERAIGLARRHNEGI